MKIQISGKVHFKVNKNMRFEYFVYNNDDLIHHSPLLYTTQSNPTEYAIRFTTAAIADTYNINPTPSFQNILIEPARQSFVAIHENYRILVYVYLLPTAYQDLLANPNPKKAINIED